MKTNNQGVEEVKERKAVRQMMYFPGTNAKYINFKKVAGILSEYS